MDSSTNTKAFDKYYMECSVVVRKTLNWHHIKTMSNFNRLCDFKQILPFVKKWNETLDMTYWEYRLGLKRIAQKTLDETDLEINYTSARLPRNHNHIIIPIDDDDWLHPNVKENILPLFENPEVKIVCWPNAWFRIIRDEALYGHVSPFMTTMSCSYAARSSLPLGKWFEHTYVRKFRKSNQEEVLYFEDKFLSIYIRHFGAVGVIKEFDRFIGCFPLRCEMPNRVSEPHAWSKPYAYEFLDFAKSIGHKSIKLL